MIKLKLHSLLEFIKLLVEEQCLELGKFACRAQARNHDNDLLAMFEQELTINNSVGSLDKYYLDYRKKFASQRKNILMT